MNSMGKFIYYDYFKAQYGKIPLSHFQNLILTLKLVYYFIYFKLRISIITGKDRVCRSRHNVTCLRFGYDMHACICVRAVAEL